jgi:IS30 family transposase
MAKKGRPKALDAGKREVIRALVSVGCTRRRAAEVVGVAPVTLWREARRNAEFQQQLDEALLTARRSADRVIAAGRRNSRRHASDAIESQALERIARRDETLCDRRVGYTGNLIADLIAMDHQAQTHLAKSFGWWEEVQ